MTIPFKPSLLAMASILALSACISGGGGTPVVKSSETPSNKVTPPADTVSPAPGADTAGTASGGDGRESKTEIPPKDTQGEGETAQAGADGGVQNDAPQHVETSTESTPEGTVESESTPKEAGEEIKPAPKEDTSEGKEAKETDPTQPSSTSESQDGTEENAVSEDTGMQASPPSETTEHTEPAMNAEDANPPSKAENSDEVGQGGMQADEASGRQDAEEGLQGDDPTAHPPQDQTPQSAADNQPKTGVFGEKYFDGTGEITALVIGGETIDLTKADEQVSRRNHPSLMSDFDKVMVSQNQYKHLIYGAAKLKDGSYTLFVQGKPTEQLPVGNATYNGKVLHFRKAYENNWFNDSAYQAAGTFTANVDFSQRTVTGKIDTKDPSGMGMQEFTASIDGSGFQGKWKSDNDQGDISGKFYGQDGAEMAGRYDYKNQDNRKDGFGVFAGKKEADAR
ncbi:TPA: transferrin-binding protein-like solute binding protein [Neisseria meningitidis]|uniref:transferrin-binding protein-like solute binding protein n=1 Tax=Neisseria meningitidis TaxID=487 RepID=UPI0009AB86CA|nr:transferrin-binding protein-like solute binding protein [Neisseria meningitidis]MBH5562255.1 transferrin-binding protein-like solute binding protein [Neisseria meningitidis]MBH6177549.1 transferrin-binding protein-like solute binding protein [Neisseria meningitidis]